jgi:hypothetical protein
MVTSRRPRFRWTFDGGGDAPAELEICADRACTRVLARIGATGTSAVPPADLPPGVVYWRVRISNDLGTLPSPTWEVTIPARSAPVDTSWGTVLDIDGDGKADVAVGAPDVGQVYVYRGGLEGLSHPPIVLRGPNGGGFGTAVASAGDVDGDGFGDLLVLAPCAGASSSCGPGRAYVYRGGPSGLETVPSSILVGPGLDTSSLLGPVERLGQGLAGAGDVNGDGYGDVVWMAPEAGVLGRAYVYLGGPGGLATTPAVTLSGADDAATMGPFSSGFSGGSFAAGADVDGDGYADLLLSGYGPPASGGSNASSQVYAFRGGPSGLSATPATMLTGGAEGILGAWMATLGDVNGDGYPDFAISRGGACDAWSLPGPRPVERVSVHWGGPAGLAPEPSATLPASTSSSTPGTTPTGPGDIDGDGYADLVLFDDWVIHGFDLSIQEFGQVHVYRGGPSGILASPAVDLPGPDGSATFVGGVLGVVSGVAGDVDGDGAPDVLVVSPIAGSPYSHSGSVHLYRGSANGLVPTSAVISPPASSFGYGTALAFYAAPIGSVPPLRRGGGR